MVSGDGLNGCELAGTKYCRLLNVKSCDGCAAHNNDVKQIVADLELYETLLPEGGVSQLFLDTDCQFCKGEPNRRNGYAILDFAHPEPKRLQRWLFGKKMTPFGTMIPVQLGICKACRRRLLAIEYLPVIIPVLMGTLGLILFSFDPIVNPLLSIASYLPFLIWLVAVFVAMLIGKAAAKGLEKKFSCETRVDILEHPVLREMLEKGWFPIFKQSRTKVMFSKSRLARGLGTASEDENE